jgi:Uncharacterised nucleotidyltransferase
MSHEAFSKPALSEALSFLLPTPEETLLLRVCLTPGESARDGWRQWRNRRNMSGKALLRNSSFRKLRPLLFNAVQSHSLEIDKEGLTYLRTAYLKEELRDAAVRRICREVLLLLEKKRLAPILLKGIALAETVYGNPVLRHCHDIDILLTDDELSRPADFLPSLGFRTCSAPDSQSRHLRMVQESGLPLEFHSSLFEVPYYEMLISEIRARSRSQVIGVVTAQILTPADNLLHVCGHASYSGKRQSLRWVSDAWFIIDRHPDLDWHLLLDSIRRSHLALPLSVMLGYLAGSLYAPIPSHFLNRLCGAAVHSEPIERQLALHGTRSDGHRSLQELFKKTTNWRERVFVIQWLLFPSPGYLCWVDQIHPWLLPFHYVYRPLRYAGSRLQSSLRGALRAVKFRIERLFLRGDRKSRENCDPINL